MLSGVQTGNEIPHDRYNIRGIAHAHTNRKDDIFMQRRLWKIFTCIFEWGQGTFKKLRPFPARAYTTLVVRVSIAFATCGYRIRINLDSVLVQILGGRKS